MMDDWARALLELRRRRDASFVRWAK